MGHIHGRMGWGWSLCALVAARMAIPVALVVTAAAAPPPAQGVDDGLHEPPPTPVRPTCIEANRCEGVPCDGLEGPPCPPDTLAGQRAYGGTEEWKACVSGSRFYDFSHGLRRFEYFQGVSAVNGIEDVHWWGLSAVYDEWGYLVECPLNPATFEIEFWAHDEYTNRPDISDPNNLICQYTLTAPQVTVNDSGHKYGDFTLWAWHAQLPSPCHMENGWLSIQNTDYCMFWWAGSPEGDGRHLVLSEQTGELEKTEGDLAYCLIGTYTPILWRLLSGL